jgi:hydroxyethylthiazole kinase-like uncharacterized protein yjeF
MATPSREPAPQEAMEVLVLTREAVREVDRRATADYGIPSVVLMENAALHLAEVVLDVCESDGPRVLILCGPGNNGGDGLAAARHLHNDGVRVEIVLSGPGSRLNGDAATNLAIDRAMGLPIREASETNPGEAVHAAVAAMGGTDVVVDALLGTGLTRTVTGPTAALIAEVNRLGSEGATVVAADLPSGLDCDSGEPLGAAVRADTTVSFAGLKAGFVRLPAQEYIGDVVVADIGAPRELIEQLGRRLEDHEPHEGPEQRPGHGPEPPSRRPERG